MINRFSESFRNHLAIRVLAGALLGLCCLPAVALADDDKAPPSGRSSGGRGCGKTTLPIQTGTPALILLAPSNQLGQTVSTRPTFAWFVRDANAIPLEFRLYERESTGFKLIQEIKGDRLKSTPGIMVLSPDPSTPELMVGKRYRWQVEMVCNPNRPSGNLFAESEIEVVPMQSGLKSQLQQTRDRRDRAKLYAQANLWYDVLGTALDPSDDGIKLKELQQTLYSRIASNSTEQELLQASKIYPAQQ